MCVRRLIPAVNSLYIMHTWPINAELNLIRLEIRQVSTLCASEELVFIVNVMNDICVKLRRTAFIHPLKLTKTPVD